MSNRTCKTCDHALKEHETAASRRECIKCINARRPRIPCQTCGGPTGWIDSPSARKRAKSPTCRPCRRARPGYRNPSKAATHALETHTCQHCGTTWTRPRTKGQRPKWCNDHRTAEDRLAPRDCAYCGKLFKPADRRTTRCSRRCVNLSLSGRPYTGADLVHRGPIYGPPAPRNTTPPLNDVSGGTWWTGFVNGPCSYCGDTFTSPTTTFTNKYCSTVCSKRATERSARQARGQFWIAERQRRAIYERDDWICQLCFDPIDQAADYLHDYAPSLDHITPRSHGGSDKPENLRTVHRWCNAIRSVGNVFTDADFLPAVAN